jgi:hypothetical protein
VPGSARFAVTLRPYATSPDKAPSTVETDMTTSINRETTVAKATIQVLP